MDDAFFKSPPRVKVENDDDELAVLFVKLAPPPRNKTQPGPSNRVPKYEEEQQQEEEEEMVEEQQQEEREPRGPAAMSARNTDRLPPPLFPMPAPPPKSNTYAMPPQLFKLPGAPKSHYDNIPRYRHDRARSPSRRDQMRDSARHASRSRTPYARYSNHDVGHGEHTSGRSPARGGVARDARAQSVMINHRSYADRNARPHSVMRSRSPARSSYGNDYAASIGAGSMIQGEIRGHYADRNAHPHSMMPRSPARSSYVPNNPAFPMRARREDEEGGDVRVFGGTIRAPSRHRSPSHDRNPFVGLEANIRKRLGNELDPLCFDWRNPVSARRDEPCSITIRSAREKAHFRVVILDPTYGSYPLEAVRVEPKNEPGMRTRKTYEFEFTPRKNGPHIVLLTMDDFFLAHPVRVRSGNGPPRPQWRWRNDNRPRLPHLEVLGVSREVQEVFHAPRPCRDDEKFVDVRSVLEGLLG